MDRCVRLSRPGAGSGDESREQAGAAMKFQQGADIFYKGAANRGLSGSFTGDACLCPNDQAQSHFNLLSHPFWCTHMPESIELVPSDWLISPLFAFDA